MAEKTDVACGSGVEELSHLWHIGSILFQEKLGADGDSTIVAEVDTTISVSSVISDLKKAQETASSSYGPKLARIMKRMELFVQVGALALQNMSKEAGLVWGCFGFIFSMGLNDSEACDLLTDGVDEATDAIFVSEIYGKRHYDERTATSECQTKKLNDNVLDKIPHLYATVLEFAYNARKFIKHGKAGRVLRFYKMPLKVFQENVDSMRTKKNELTLVAGIGFEEVARDSLKHIQDGLKKLDELEKIGENLKELKKEQAKHRQEKEEAQVLQEFKSQLQWFRTSAEPVKRNMKNLERKQAETCRWIFKEPDYQKWHETLEIPLLWISASQGFGKSILVSSIIEALETEIRNVPSGSTTLPAIELIYFFVQTGSDDTQSSGRILQHLFFQLFLKAEQQKKLRDKCTEIVKIAKEKIRGSRTETDTTCNMSVQELRPLFESIIQAFEKQIIMIIDGLDECKDLEKENFLGLIKDISQAGLPVKFLVSSRPEPYIERAFADITRIEVSKYKTQKDIQLYLIEEVRLIQHIPSGERKRAAKLIHKKADGMFRYANLAIDFLKHPFRGTFQQKLARFPDAMEDFYRQNLEKMDEKMRELLLIALRWRIYGQGAGVDYTAVQVAEEFEHKYEDPINTDNENDTTAEKEGSTTGDDQDDWWPDEEPERQIQKAEGSIEDPKTQESEFQLTLELLRRAGGEFLAIGQNNILELRHKSVQDFIIDYAEKVTKKLVHRKTFCSNCLDRERSAFIYQLGPRQAHLHMALISLKHLNNKQFQEEHLVDKDSKTVEEENTQKSGMENSEGQFEPEILKEPAQTEQILSDGEPDKTPTEDAATMDDTVTTEDAVTAENGATAGDGTEGAAVETSGDDSTLEKIVDEPAEEEQDDQFDNAIISDPINLGIDYDIDAQSDNGYDVADYQRTFADNDYDSFGTERYEFRNWDFHIREAYNLSYSEGKLELEQSEIELWKEIWDQVDKFMVEDGPAFIAWQKKKLPWRDFFEKPIHIAARCGLIETMERLLKKGADINLRNGFGHAPLHCAYDYRMTKYLVEKGANVNAQDNWDETPLQSGIAFSVLDLQSIKHLLEHGADPFITDDESITCVHWAAHHGEADIFQLLLEHKARDLINAKDNEGETPLHWLLKSTTASTAVLELLLENGADINAKDNSSQGPLYEAVNAGNQVAVKILIERGVSINDQEDIFGRTALHVAVDATNLDMTVILVDGKAEVDIRDKNGMTPLAIAAQKGLTQIVQCFIKTEKGLDVEYRGAADSRKRTGLHKSASRGHFEVVKLLLDTPDATALCNKTNEHRATPLHAAARRKDRHEIVGILLEKGANLNYTNRYGKKPFDLALDGYARDCDSYRETMKILVGAAPDVAVLNLRLLHTAASQGDEDLCRLLFSLGANPTAKDQHGWDTVSIAQQYDRENIIIPIILECPGAPFLFNNFGIIEDGDSASYKPPTAWSFTDKSSVLSVSTDGLVVTEASNAMWGTVGSVRSNHPMPADINVFYYEITVLSSYAEAPEIGIGVCDEWAIIENTMPGWVDVRSLSWGFHADDARLYSPDTSLEYDVGRDYGANWGQGDTVGCGVDRGKGHIFFTKNGIFLGVAFENPRGRLFPVCGTRVASHEAKWQANFGQDPEKKFVFDIEAYKNGEKMERLGPAPAE